MPIKPRHALAALAAFLLLLAANAHAYDAESLVVARQGSMPVILAVPHDGTDPVPGVPPRSQGTTVRDLNSRLLAERAAEFIEKKTGRARATAVPSSHWWQGTARRPLWGRAA